MFYPAFVCLSVSLSNLAQKKTYWLDLRENFTRNVSYCINKKELIKFWKSFSSGSYETFERFFNTARQVIFSTSWPISLKNLIESSRKFYRRCYTECLHWILEVVRVQRLDPDSEVRNPDRTRLSGGLSSSSALVGYVAEQRSRCWSVTYELCWHLP